MCENRLRAPLSLALLLFCWLGAFLPTPAAAPPDPDGEARVLALYEDYRQEFPGIAEITAAEALRRWQAGEKPLFVDTRTAAEMAISTLPEAISAESFLDDPAPYRGRTVIAYCTVSYRSGLFIRDRVSPEWTAYNLRGGILAWLHAGGPVYDGKRQVRRVHVYSDRWNYPPEGYETVVFSAWERLFGP